MLHSVGNLPVESFIGCDVVDVAQPLSSLKPKLVWSTTSVQNSVNMHLDPADTLRFNRVLVLVVWLRKFITNHELPVELCDSSILLGFGVVPAKNTWHTFISEEVPVNVSRSQLLSSCHRCLTCGISCCSKPGCRGDHPHWMCWQRWCQLRPSH